MEKKRLIRAFAAGAVICLLDMGAGTVQSRATGLRFSQEDSLSVAGAIADTAFVFNADRAIPMSGRNINLNYPYSLEVAKDTVKSCLPYFGRAYSIPYGGGDGLSFEGIAADYKSGKGKKGETEISFSVRTDEDFFKFSLKVYPGGSAFLTVIPVNRQSISYSGRVVALEPEAGDR